MKEKPGRKKANYALHYIRTDTWCMVDEERLESFMKNKSVDQFLYDRDFSHETVNALLLACIY